MRVRAIQNGYYNNQYKATGSVFELIPYKGNKPVFDDKGKAVLEKGSRVQKIEKNHTFTAEEQFSEKWMEKVDGDVKPGTMKDRISRNPIKDEANGRPLPAQHGEIETPSDREESDDVI